jgi:hypothetical protein
MGDYQPRRPVGIGKVSREEVIEINQSNISIRPQSTGNDSHGTDQGPVDDPLRHDRVPSEEPIPNAPADQQQPTNNQQCDHTRILVSSIGIIHKRKWS